MDLKSKNSIEIMLIMAIIFIATYAIVFSIKTPTGESKKLITCREYGCGGGSSGDFVSVITLVSPPPTIYPNLSTRNVAFVFIKPQIFDSDGISRINVYIDNVLYYTTFVGGLTESNPIIPWDLFYYPDDFGDKTIKVEVIDQLNNIESQSFIRSFINYYLAFYAHYNSNANADYSLDSLTPTQNVGTTIVPGKYGNGILIDSTDKLYYSSPNASQTPPAPPSPSFETAGTIAMWIKPTWGGNNLTKHHSLFTMRNSDTDYFQFDIHNGPTFYGLSAWTQQGSGLNGIKGLVNASITNWQPNQWHHVATTWGSGVRKLYIDGVLVDSEVYDGQALITVPSQITIGMNSYNNGEQADAIIDEVLITSNQLSDAQILTEYQKFQ